MLKQHWLYQNTFKQYLEENKNIKSYFIVEEYETKKFKIIEYQNQKSLIYDLQHKNKCYYNIFYQPSRHLYLDFDHYLKYDLNKNDIYSIGKEIVRLLTNFYNIHNSNTASRIKALDLKDFYVFDSSRHIKYKEYNFKLSLHVYSYRIFYENVHLLKHHIEIMKQFITETLNNFTPSCNIINIAFNSFKQIDHSIYKDIQYLRTYNCCKYNEPTSKKKKLYPKTEISFNEIIKIMNVDRNDLKDISIHFKSLSNNINFKTTIQHKQITHLPFNNNKLLVSSTSSSSMTRLYKYEYIFSAKANELQWKEDRIYQNNKIISISYNCINADIQYPRLFLNLTNFPLQEIKTLNLKLKKSNIKIKNTFNILFTNWVTGKKNNIEYIIYFNKNNVTLHNHSPLFIKKHFNTTKNKYKKLFSIYCQDCGKFFDL